MPIRRRIVDVVNKLSMTEQERIASLVRLGWSDRRIVRETGHHRATVRRIRRELAKCTSAPEAPADPKCTEVPTDRGTTRSSCEPHRAFIAGEVAKRRNAMAIYQDLVEHHGYDGSYDAVKRFARTLRKDQPKVSCRFETLPGQEAQVDYGEGAPTRHPKTGKYRKPRLFVMSLGFSRDAFRKTIWKSSKQAWSELHEEAFAHFGGVPATIRLDNLKEGVVEPDVYDPELNAVYAAMLKHYGCVGLPCRPYHPDEKGKVESAVGHTQRTALQGRKFESLEEQNDFLAHWNERWARTRIHGTTKRQVREMYEQERPALLPLPATRFEYFRDGERRVHFDGHIEVDGAYYSVPPRHVGTKVIVHVGRLWLRILDSQTHQLIREHAITDKGQRRTVAEDLPKQTPPQVEKLVSQLVKLGTACGVFARAVENERGPLALRTLFGLLDLVRRHGIEPVEQACMLAASAGVWRLRFLRACLAQQSSKPLTSKHRIIPTIDTYAKHFATRTQGELRFDN
jgi:transposase